MPRRNKRKQTAAEATLDYGFSDATAAATAYPTAWSRFTDASWLAFHDRQQAEARQAKMRPSRLKRQLYAIRKQQAAEQARGSRDVLAGSKVQID